MPKRNTNHSIRSPVIIRTSVDNFIDADIILCDENNMKSILSHNT